jgi:hypothetical protein
MSKSSDWESIPWPSKKEDLTFEEAKWLRDNKPECTWRAISELFCEKFYPNALEWPKCVGNQLHGTALCKYAAEHFGEDYMSDEVWNG